MHRISSDSLHFFHILVVAIVAGVLSVVVVFVVSTFLCDSFALVLCHCRVCYHPLPSPPPPPPSPHCISVLVFSHIFSRKIVIVFHRSVIAWVGVDESTDDRSRCHGTGAEKCIRYVHIGRCTVCIHCPSPTIFVVVRSVRFVGCQQIGENCISRQFLISCAKCNYAHPRHTTNE